MGFGFGSGFGFGFGFVVWGLNTTTSTLTLNLSATWPLAACAKATLQTSRALSSPAGGKVRDWDWGVGLWKWGFEVGFRVHAWFEDSGLEHFTVFRA